METQDLIGRANLKRRPGVWFLATGAALTVALTGCVTPNMISNPPAMPLGSSTPAAPLDEGTDERTDETTPSSPPSSGVIGGVPVIPAIDGGSRATATGATLALEGQLVRYVVESGDTFEGIAARFGLDEIYLLTINSIRRQDMELFVGDEINLSPYYITSIGTQNGNVFANSGPSQMPPQRVIQLE
jgi:LysM repeat protein